MSNVIGGSKSTLYFQVPESLVTSGNLRDLSKAAIKIYIFLCRQLNRTGQVEHHLKNEELCNYAGVSDHKTVANARTELAARGLISHRKGPGGVYIYVPIGDDGERFMPAAGRKPVHYSLPSERQRLDSHRRRAKPARGVVGNKRAKNRPNVVAAGRYSAGLQRESPKLQIIQDLICGFDPNAYLLLRG